MKRGGLRHNTLTDYARVDNGAITGETETAFEILANHDNAGEFEALITGRKPYLGESPDAPRDIREVAIESKDVIRSKSPYDIFIPIFLPRRQDVQFIA